ncbi:glycoside hydrolase/deacetylase [Thozetella sp. PMI_491]|nr:glycoside hydrolase/deacetylase [Thozetella sp. PMI_491]
MPQGHDTSSAYHFDRDLKGYGEQGLKLKWPGGAKIAVSFVINYEEGGEHSVLNGDEIGENMLLDSPRPPHVNMRSYIAESEYEYGSRAGFWRLFRLFNKHGMKFTLFAVTKALESNPEVASRCVDEGHEVASHGYRWVNHQHHSPEKEQADIRTAITTIKSLTGEAPKGWYYGRPSPRSRSLVPAVYRELGEKLVWMSDTYADDVPYWTDLPPEVGSLDGDHTGLLMLPYTFDNNDMKFLTGSVPGFGSPDDFFTYLKNAFDVLYEEGCDGTPKMMTVGLHCRIIGRPGRFESLRRFVAYISTKEGVWVATRTDIAEAFQKQFPYRKGFLV